MSANRFFNILVVMALALVAALTVREAVATSAVLSDAEKAERAQAADAARWTAMGEYYENLAKSQNLDRGRAADTARWTAMADYYQRHPALRLADGSAMDTTDYFFRHSAVGSGTQSVDLTDYYFRQAGGR